MHGLLVNWISVILDMTLESITYMYFWLEHFMTVNLIFETPEHNKVLYFPDPVFMDSELTLADGGKTIFFALAILLSCLGHASLVHGQGIRIPKLAIEDLVIRFGSSPLLLLTVDDSFCK